MLSYAGFWKNDFVILLRSERIIFSVFLRLFGVGEGGVVIKGRKNLRAKRDVMLLRISYATRVQIQFVNNVPNPLVTE